MAWEIGSYGYIPPTAAWEIGAYGFTGITSTAWEIGAYGFTADTTFYPPVSDSVTGSWTPSAGATLFGTVDETSPDDSDYDQSSLNPTADLMTVGFNIALISGAATTDHRIYYRIKGDNGCNGTVVLKCGATTIKTWTHTPAPSTFTTFTQTLLPSEAATITNYDLLTLSIQAN